MSNTQHHLFCCFCRDHRNSHAVANYEYARSFLTKPLLVLRSGTPRFKRFDQVVAYATRFPVRERPSGRLTAGLTNKTSEVVDLMR